MRVVIMKSADAPGSAGLSFEEQVESVLKHIPETWMQYPQDAAGKTAIINMEHNEFRAACSEESKAHELVHLAAACKYLWEELNDDK